MPFQVNKKEYVYFYISLVVSVVFYYFLCVSYARILTSMHMYMGVFCFHAIGIGIFLLFTHVVLIGHLRGNAIEITKDQLPEVYKILENQSQILKLSDTPTMYLLQGDGVLNAFATKFLGTNYVIIYSDVLEIAWTEGVEAVEFIIAHELGHIQRNHMSLLKKLLLLPSLFVPFLRSAYARACEYTCDNIGFSLSPEGARKGLLILASGKSLYKKVNLGAYVRNANNVSGFASWLAEICSTHPHLTKRLENLGLQSDADTANGQSTHDQGVHKARML
jgi:Zn-dependent protease with chaperone function